MEEVCEGSETFDVGSKYSRQMACPRYIIPFGIWIALTTCFSFLTATKRQFDQGVGPAFDGSSGVDAEDIINIPQIGYGSFQLFPDQNNYGPDDPNLPAFNNTVNTGLSWIQTHAQLGQT